MKPVAVATCGACCLMLVLAACGGSSNTPTAPTPPPTNPPPSAVQIAIVGDRGAQSFSPNPASATQGQTMTWKNNDGVTHRIVANDGSFDTGAIAGGATSAVITMRTDGMNYHCSIHPGMIGSINASTGAPPPCTGQYC